MFVKRIAQATVVAQTLFVMGFLAVGAAEGHGYRWMRDDISDLGAQTAHHATVWRLLLLVTGAVTMAFGLLVVGPVFGSPLAGVLVALSLPAFDNLTDAFFRLDCRAADAGCSASQAISSWHATAHIVCFGVAAVATAAAPFVLARAMNRDDNWRSRARSVRRFGVLAVTLLILTGAASGSPVQGLAQRVAATVIPLGLATLAWLVVEQEHRVTRVADLVRGK
ncbi:hypothetical protein JCM18899A_46720 [Nocardioides sp. AN3]